MGHPASPAEQSHPLSYGSGAFNRQEYVSRINRVIDFIDSNLDCRFTLEQLAEIACFSRFHFHRIFSAMVGETIADFIRRLRLERCAAGLLDHPKQSITEVALDFGFSSSSVFARAFKERFGISAPEWRAGGWRGYRKESKAASKDDQSDSKDGEAMQEGFPYTLEHRLEHRRKEVSKLKYTVEVKMMPELHVAYVRHIGPYQEIGNAFGTLMKWAGPRGLLRFPETKCLAVYHDSPEITETSKLRSDACITVPADTKVDGEIGFLTVPSGCATSCTSTTTNSTLRRSSSWTSASRSSRFE